MINGYIPAARFLPFLSWTDVAALPDKSNTVIVLPTGAIEQHGPHLPCSVDLSLIHICLQRGAPTAGHRPNSHIVQAEVARIVQQVNGKVRLHADLQGAALR